MFNFIDSVRLALNIVDFYAPSVKLVIEVDGSQHYQPEHKHQDTARDKYLANCGLTVLRFDNRQVLQETEAVVGMISAWVDGIRNPP